MVTYQPINLSSNKDKKLKIFIILLIL
jgi:hypothetical protein